LYHRENTTRGESIGRVAFVILTDTWLNLAPMSLKLNQQVFEREKFCLFTFACLHLYFKICFTVSKLTSFSFEFFENQQSEPQQQDFWATKNLAHISNTQTHDNFLAC